MEEEKQEEEEWGRAEVIFGRLIRIDRYRKMITIEYKEEDEWVKANLSTEGFSKEDYEGLKEQLGEDIEITSIDGKVKEWR